MPTFAFDEDTPVVVDFEPAHGAYDVTNLSPEQVAQRSAEALDDAMGTIHHMARRVIATIDALPHRPTQAQVQFGIKLTAAAGALLTKVGAEATINVTLTLEREQASHEQPTS